MRVEYLECGRIINTHGTDGAIKLESWCDTPQVLAGLSNVYLKENGGYVTHRVVRASVFKSFVIMHLEGLCDIDSAMALKNRIVFAARAELPADKGYFIADLIGLDVIDAASGHIYGRLCDVVNGGASDIYVIDTPDGERMMPAVSEFIDRVELESGIYIKPIEGMF